MRKVLYILTLVLALPLVSLAQLTKVNEATKLAAAGDWAGAKLAIDQAMTDAEMQKSAQAWYTKGFIYKQLYKDKESTNPQSSFRSEALKSLKNSVDIEAEGKYSTDCKTMITYLTSTMYNDAARAMNAQNFKDAFHNYEGYINAKNMVDPAGVEDKVIFYAGYTAYMNSNFEASLKYFNLAKDKNYPDYLLYFFLAKIYHAKKDYASATETLTEGKEKYPLAKDLNDLYINIMLEQGKLTALEDDLNKAINLEPDNLELYVTLAVLYGKKSEIDVANQEVYTQKTIETYKRILAKDPNHMRANYNLATLYYNQAVNIMKSSNEDDIFALNEIQDQCIALFQESLPFFLKAHETEPNNKEVLIGLGGVYFSLNNMEKSDEFKAKLEKLEQNK